MNTKTQRRFTASLQENTKLIKTLLPSEDILSYPFTTEDKVKCALFYADGMVNKELLGRLVATPLSFLRLKKPNGRGKVANTEKIILENTRFPELKTVESVDDAVAEILDGNTLLLVDNLPTPFIVGAKLLPVRAITEPPTDIAVKGPREGFIEDIKTNMSLIRKRLKTPSLRFETLKVGRRSETLVTICYLDGVSNNAIKEEIKQKLLAIDTDIIVDSSYITAFLSPRKHSVFKSVGTTEKPDIFTAKIAEGRVGVIVDGSPIALTFPYLAVEDFQTSEDYFISPFVATTFRFLRFIALFVALFLPAFYISAQLFKIQLLPLGLTLTIASSVRELPLSPAMEIFVVLLLLETLKEASIRMPKYVGMSLSVVGALVLGETAVRAGFLSTPAIIIVAFSGICLYTVPNFVETGSVLRWIFLIIAGALGPFGIVLISTFTLFYMLTSDAYGAPLLAPFSPLIKSDLHDSIVKYDMQSLSTRPAVFKSKNKTRLGKYPNKE